MSVAATAAALRAVTTDSTRNGRQLKRAQGGEDIMCADTLITDERTEVAAPEEQPVIAALAWRVSFIEGAKTESPDEVLIKKPRNLTAILTPIDMQEAWEEGSRVTGHSLILVWAPPGVNGPFGVERDFDERTLVRAGIRAVRVAWDGARAVIWCAADHLRDAIDAVLRFSAVEWETTDIERLLASTWPVVGEDAPLAHSIRRGQLRRQKRVNALTESCVHVKGSRRGGGWKLVGVVSGLPNPNDSSVGALEWRPRHEEGYHEGDGCRRREFAFR